MKFYNHQSAYSFGLSPARLCVCVQHGGPHPNTDTHTKGNSDQLANIHLHINACCAHINRNANGPTDPDFYAHAIAYDNVIHLAHRFARPARL